MKLRQIYKIFFIYQKIITLIVSRIFCIFAYNNIVHPSGKEKKERFFHRMSLFSMLNCYINESVQKTIVKQLKQNKNMDLRYLVPILVPIACGCVLPIMIIWFSVREKMNKTNQHTQIVLAAIEKNPEMDIEELMKKISPKPRLLKEKLLTKLLWGCLTTMLGIGLIFYGIYLNVNHYGGTHDPAGFICLGLILSGIGVAFLINYRVGKKMLTKEMEAEEQQLVARAESK